MEIRSFVADELGNSSHMLLVPEAGLAAAIDPLRVVAQYLEIIENTGLKLVWALETHVHNDFVSGSRELQSEAGEKAGRSAGPPSIDGLVRPGPSSCLVVQRMSSYEHSSGLVPQWWQSPTEMINTNGARDHGRSQHDA